MPLLATRRRGQAFGSSANERTHQRDASYTRSDRPEPIHGYQRRRER